MREFEQVPAIDREADAGAGRALEVAPGRLGATVARPRAVGGGGLFRSWPWLFGDAPVASDAEIEFCPTVRFLSEVRYTGQSAF